jgi:hypothetical protein
LCSWNPYPQNLIPNRICILLAPPGPAAPAGLHAPHVPGSAPPPSRACPHAARYFPPAARAARAGGGWRRRTQRARAEDRRPQPHSKTRKAGEPCVGRARGRANRRSAHERGSRPRLSCWVLGRARGEAAPRAVPTVPPAHPGHTAPPTRVAQGCEGPAASSGGGGCGCGGAEVEGALEVGRVGEVVQHLRQVIEHKRQWSSTCSAHEHRAQAQHGA